MTLGLVREEGECADLPPPNGDRRWPCGIVREEGKNDTLPHCLFPPKAKNKHTRPSSAEMEQFTALSTHLTVQDGDTAPSLERKAPALISPPHGEGQRHNIIVKNEANDGSLPPPNGEGQMYIAIIKDESDDGSLPPRNGEGRRRGTIVKEP